VLFLKRVLLVLLALFLALVLIIGTVKALVKLRIITIQSVISVTGAELPKDENGYTNLLLLGEGDAGHDGKDLTDTVIVASIDAAKTQSVTLLSLPRDLYFLNTERMGKGRLNSLYRDYKIALRHQGMEEAEASQEAMKELAKVIGNALDLSIHHVVKVNFSGFVKAVDAIGGIDLIVPYDINDLEYPDENYGYEPFSIAAGPAHLDGTTALKYVRSRHTTSDFDRSGRQQQVIAALAEAVKSQGLYKKSSTIIEMLKIFSDDVEMTLSTRELIGLAGLAEDLSPSRVINMQLNDRNGLYDSFVEPGGLLYAPPRDLFEGASVLLPVSIPEFPITWRQIHLFSHLIFQKRELFLASPSLAVLNAGARSGLARRLGTELIRFGWKVDNIANASEDKTTKFDSSFVSPLTEQDTVIAQPIADLFKLPLKPLPQNIDVKEARPVTIVLGVDYAYRPLQDLLLPQ
jgi:LCP family protein required for cell wall assembly